MTRLVARSVAPILTAVAVFLPAAPMSAGGPLAVPRNHPIGTKVNAFRAVTGIPAGVAEKSVPPALALAAAAPNPVAGFAKIRFVLPAEGWVRLALYDVAGRRVRTCSRERCLRARAWPIGTAGTTGARPCPRPSISRGWRAGAR